MSTYQILNCFYNKYLSVKIDLYQREFKKQRHVRNKNFGNYFAETQ